MNIYIYEAYLSASWVTISSLRLRPVDECSSSGSRYCLAASEGVSSAAPSILYSGSRLGSCAKTSGASYGRSVAAAAVLCNGGPDELQYTLVLLS